MLENKMCNFLICASELNYQRTMVVKIKQYKGNLTTVSWGYYRYAIGYSFYRLLS